MNAQVKQIPLGKQWEDKAIANILKKTIYIPRGAINPSKIKVINRQKMSEHIKTEGYGK